PSASEDVSAPSPGAAGQDAGEPLAADPADAGVDDGSESASAPPAGEATTAPKDPIQPATDGAGGDASDRDTAMPDVTPPDAVANTPADAAAPTDTLDPLPLDEPPAPVDTGATATDPAADPGQA